LPPWGEAHVRNRMNPVGETTIKVGLYLKPAGKAPKCETLSNFFL